jgi:glycosyltransferase involved in cell wall biosynthesis
MTIAERKDEKSPYFPSASGALTSRVPGNQSVSMGVAPNSSVRRILVISYHFPPDGAIGGQRWAGLSKYLARLGWEVHVITASASNGQPDTPGVHRHVRHPRRTLNDVYKDAAGRLRQSQNTIRELPAGNPARPPRFSPIRPLAAVRRAVGASMFLPDHGRGWVGRAAAAARSLLREQNFDVVITSGPPHSSHFAGLLATRGGATPFWIDMRDPWSKTHKSHLPTDWLSRAECFFLRRLERLVFPRASRVIANTREFESVLKTCEPDLDVLWFPNGIDLEQLPARDESEVERGSIAYVGSLYLNESLSSVLAAMRSLLRDRPEAATTLKLHVVGSVDSPNREQMQADIEAGGLASLVNVHGVLPRAQALELLRRSQLALVLAQGLPMSVPAKIYESVGLGVPTLVIGEETSAAAREARRIGAMTLDDGDVDGLRLLMEDMLDGRLPARIDSQTPISYEDLAIRMDRLLQEAVTA